MLAGRSTTATRARQTLLMYAVGADSGTVLLLPR
jgi:hypothetical protein